MLAVAAARWLVRAHVGFGLELEGLLVTVGREDALNRPSVLLVCVSLASSRSEFVYSLGAVAWGFVTIFVVFFDSHSERVLVSV